ncbi:MAG: hypothetical protein AUK63_2687 [bacterium P3]|nr:MAG: hypothetical protein AUK63_2687 [bacterium P3]
MSSSTTSGLKVRMVSISTLGEAMSSTSAKRMGSNIFSADRMPALSSTTKILDLSLDISVISCKLYVF